MISIPVSIAINYGDYFSGGDATAPVKEQEQKQKQRREDLVTEPNLPETNYFWIVFHF